MFISRKSSSGYKSKCFAYRNATQGVLNGTWTKLQLNTKSYDTLSEFDNATNHRFTAIAAGFYHVAGYALFEHVAAIGVGVSIYKNGASIAQAFERKDSAVSSNEGVHVVRDVQLAVGDYLELWVWQTSGGTRNVEADEAKNGFSVSRFG